MIEKLEKEFVKIRSSLAKSKKLIMSDIDKIDEKYRKLAQEEKKSLTENLAILNEQLKYYDKMLGTAPAEEATEEIEEAGTDNEVQQVEEEPVIQDTIFPENNEPEEQEVKVEETSVSVQEAEPEEKNDAVVESADATEPLESFVEEIAESDVDGIAAIEDVPEVTDASSDGALNVKVDENGWPVW